jgi:hypothetical protein
MAILSKEHQTVNQDMRYKFTARGDAKIHDPTEYLSSDFAMANRHCVHSESASSKAKLRELAAFVRDHGMYLRLSNFFDGPRLSGSSLNEPKH